MLYNEKIFSSKQSGPLLELAKFAFNLDFYILKQKMSKLKVLQKNQQYFQS